MTKKFLQFIKEAQEEALQNYEEKIEEQCSNLSELFSVISDLVIRAIASYDYDSETYKRNAIEPNRKVLGNYSSIILSNSCSLELRGRKSIPNCSYIELVYGPDELELKDEELEILNGVLSTNNIEVIKSDNIPNACPRLIISFDNSILNIDPEEKEKVKKKVYKRYAESEL